jgi:FMN phosphatase YigB (HAD superfamily)
MDKKIVYFDMDGVLVNFQSGIDQLNHVDLELYKGNYDKVPNIFSTMKPNLDMISLWEQMVDDERYDCYILSTSPGTMQPLPLIR